VIIYYGEVPLPADSFSAAQGGPGKFFDLANLQVLKGPQGTLFGRNTTGGALLLEPHKPEPYFEASLKGELGNFADKGVEGILNLPVVDDQLSLRLGAKYYERKGFTKDIINGEDLDSKGFRTMRLGLLWKPTEGVQNYMLGYYTHSADDGTSQVIEQINRSVIVSGINVGCAAVAAGAQGNYLSNYKTCGRDVIAAQQARGVRAVALSTAPDDILDTGGIIDQFSYDINSNITLRNIASYQAYAHHSRGDNDGSILVLNEFNAPDGDNSTDIESYTEELQVQGHALGSDLKYVGGFYYQYQQPSGPQQDTSTQLGLVNTSNHYTLSNRSYGPYVQATYNIGGVFDSLDGLNATAGVRESFDYATGSVHLGSYVGNSRTPLFGGTNFETSVRNSAPTWTIGTDYKVPTTLLYGKVSRGYKSGGISTEAVSPSRYTYKPELVTTYEIGHKSDFALGEIPVRINSAFYYTDYTNIQKIGEDNNGVSFGAAVVNAGKASLTGFETEITMQPIDGLTLLINYSYSYAKYEEFILTLSAITPQIDCTGREITNGQIAQLQCMPFDYVPKHQGNVTARYEIPIPESIGKVAGSVTYSFVDRQYSSSITIPQAEPGAWLGAYGLLNSTLEWNGIYGSAFDLQLFGTNLTDRTYRIYNSGTWNFLYFQSSVYGEPRMYGLQLSYHWGN
jgi:iron complex outermembrane receptor protein